MKNLLRWGWNALPIPAFLRSVVERRYLYPHLRHLRRASRYPSGPTLVAGFLRSGLGIGEAGRLDVLALRASGKFPELLDVSRIHDIHDFDSPEFADTAIPSEHGVLILHVNAPEVGLALRFMGEKLTRNRPVIGYWAWELPVSPPDWLLACRYLDELWVPSRYVANSFRDCPVPVRVVPHPVFAPLVRRGRIRSDFGLPLHACLFLCLGDGRSDLTRKNLIGAVEAFEAAFAGDRSVHLVVKLHHAAPGGAAVEALLRKVQAMPNCSLFSELLDRNDMGDFMDCADVLVSLHRAEGFGLVMAEAMMLGKPVIATGYSGNMDFMDASCAALVGYDLIPAKGHNRSYRGLENAKWAEPHLEEAAHWMKRIAADNSLREKIGRNGRKYVEKKTDPGLFVAAVDDVRSRYLSGNG